ETRVPTMAEVQAAVDAARKKKSQPEPEGDREPLPSESPGRRERQRAPVGATASEPVGEQAGHELWERAAADRDPWVDEEADAEEEFKLHRRGLDEGGLDMTPMVDVTFLLLIFFMITAAFNVQKSMQADPPQPEDEGAAQQMTVEEQEQNDLIVGISEKDELTLDDEPIGGIGALADALRARASSGDSELAMTIEADPRCTFGILVGVMDVGISSGMQRIRRVSRPVEE
ncbi:MAG: biopolymer transporter ExbD, partial [Planctomycetaceae bacterium]|nr:biopolymer transporter ExbD [Planctomycetaceae bacterium]